MLKNTKDGVLLLLEQSSDMGLFRWHSLCERHSKNKPSLLSAGSESCHSEGHQVMFGEAK